MRTSSESAGNDSPLAGMAADGFRGLMGLLFPPHCVVCEQSLRDQDDPYFCPDCRDALPFVGESRCRKCGHELAEYAPSRARCRACHGKSLFFESATAPFKYETSIRELILQFKLANQSLLALPLAVHLIEHLTDAGIMDGIDIIVPVPLHWRRRLTRGYNQALLLARPVARHFEVPLFDRCLVRVAPTRSQTSFSMKRRMENLRGAFGIRKRGTLSGRAILLIDDVLTTGATCAECSRVLKHEGGAGAVYVATVARTMF